MIFYKEAINCDAIVFPRQPHSKLQSFYQASDIFILPGSEQFNRWGGIGISTIEALACNTPVVSGTLIHFPNNYQKLGVCAHSESEVINGIDYIFQHPDKFANCRESARKYYDWSNIVNNTCSIYEKLFYKYYKIKLEKNDK